MHDTAASQTSTRPDTVVLIHGLWMTPRSWEHWIERYGQAGYRVLAPAWPGMEGSVDELRADPTPYAHLGIPEIVDHYASIVENLDSPPIIMGHSFGGAFTEILLDRGYGAAGVAIDPAPVKGVLSLPLSTLRSAFPDLHVRIDRILSEEPLAAVHLIATGTHLGPFHGSPPTGRRWSSTCTAIFEIGERGIVDFWLNWDSLDMLEQLRIVTRTAEASA